MAQIPVQSCELFNLHYAESADWDGRVHLDRFFMSYLGSYLAESVGVACNNCKLKPDCKPELDVATKTVKRQQV